MPESGDFGALRAGGPPLSGLRIAVDAVPHMKDWFGRWIGWVRVVAFLGVLFGLVIRVGDPVPVEALRNAAFDFYQQIKPREAVPVPVAILDIDDRSLEELGQWPWPRNRVAEMVRAATAAGAVAIAFDVVFAEPDRLSPAQIAADNPNLPPDLVIRLRSMADNDRILADAFAASRVVVGQTSVRTFEANREEKREMREVAHAFIGGDPMPFLQRFPDVVQNLDVLEDAASGRGVFSVRPDPDGVYRRVPLVMLVQDKVRLGLSPELLRVATGGEAFAVRVNEAGIEGVVVARQLVETASDGTVWPYLSPSSRARYVSAADLIGGTVPPGRLAGHLVLVGTSAIGLEDFRATPLGVAMAGVEIHAQLLENILTGTLLVRPNYAIGAELAITFLLCLLVIIFAPNLSGQVLIGSSLVLLTGYMALSWNLFATDRILIDPTFPVLSALLTVMLISTVNYLREERQRRQIRSAFGQYVSPALVEQLSRNQRELQLGGETRDLTLLFSDVRGFTAIAEAFKDDPEGLTQLMNRFLTVLCDGIMATGGTIDKFMGDAVMAFWNAPLDHPDHAASACAAALRMRADIAALNEVRAAEEGGDAHRLNVGIGINTGTCVVGNMGSKTRFDYTALGDPVNVASRLEGQSRYYGVDIILGSATATAVGERFAVFELDRVRVVGKALPETIFALLGDAATRADPAFQALCAANAAMLRAYRARDWDGADAGLAQVRAMIVNAGLPLSAYCDLYATRIADLRATPPGEDWDGVFSSTKK